VYSFDRLLCPTDFSDASLYALRFAAFIAGPANGSIKLFHVDEFERAPYGAFALSDEERTAHRERVTQFVNERFERIRGEAHLAQDRTSRAVRFGTAYHEIIREAEIHRYSAVVIATGGLGETSPQLLGRTVERVVRLCRAPVITVRPREEKDPWRIRTILCPTDFSEYANYALPYATSIARRTNARIILLHTTDLLVQHPELLMQKFPDLTTYHEQGDEVKVEKLVGRDVEPENTIVRIAEEYEADLIVMGTHGARGLRRVQIGNTTEEVVRRTSVPVLTITHPIHKSVFPKRFLEEYDEPAD
jgi:nucleotide-binding universal stress UspA family protein